MSAVASLWPTEIFGQSVRTPAVVLKEQASVIGQQTKNLIEGRVSSYQVASNKIGHKFSLFVPTMNFTYTLFTAEHDANLYPVNVWSDFLASPTRTSLANNEDELNGVLRTIFNSDEAKKLVVALLSQAKA